MTKNKQRILNSGVSLTFDSLVESVRSLNTQLELQASKAVNLALTVRNWFIGSYISEYELRGSDRATYGEQLYQLLAERLEKLGVPGCRKRQLYYYVAFYRAYPQIVRTLSAQFQAKLMIPMSNKKVRSTSAQSLIEHEQLLQRLSYSHFEQLLEIEDPLKRSFYEVECFRGGWSVRELKRQIATLYFERSGLSKNKKKLSALTQKKAEANDPTLVIRDPYVFEFLGIKPAEVMGESRLEDALLDKLQSFLLEMGHGFCFEARQKRIVIGGEYLFIDLVFYHRVLKCHVLIELKTDKFSHENLGQLNTYVSWYQKHEQSSGDNQPIGILLCTKKNHSLVDYALAGMDNKLFVSKYQLELPKKEEIERFLDEQIRKVGLVETKANTKGKAAPAKKPKRRR